MRVVSLNRNSSLHFSVGSLFCANSLDIGRFSGHPNMSWFRVSRKTLLLPYLKNSESPNLGCVSRHVLDKPIGANANYGQNLGFTTRLLMQKCEFHSGLFDKNRQFLPVALRYSGRPSYCSVLDIRRHYVTDASAEQERKSKKMLKYLTALVFAMVAGSYAAVPLYQRFCQATGYGGTVHRRETVEEKIARHDQDGTVSSREIVVQFNADVADGMQWKFTPTQREIRVKPGESALAFYTAENQSSIPITGVSTYNVTPMKAALYFNKIQCFCFEEQRLLPGEQIDMPVFFYIDPEIETDPKMDGVNNLILSYTFFKSNEEK